MKINTLELENIKRVKAVKLEPAANGLTVIGGRNGQGKTSVLDAIAWALGGNKFRPTDAQRDGSVIPPRLKITLDNGMIVERSGKNGTLKVIDPTGNKSGQQLLDSFISELALDLPKFMNMNNKEKARVLLEIIGVGDKLFELENKENTLYNRRTEIGRIADRKKKYADELPIHSGIPAEPVSAAIVRRLNPKCGFVLLDKLEQMDVDTLNDFGKWLEAEGLQAIATRVSTGEECSVIIEDGYVKNEENDIKNISKGWVAGKF